LKTLTINMDTVLLLGVTMALSLGMNAWQYFQASRILAEDLDLQTRAQDDRASLVYTRTLLKQCDPAKYADLDVNR
jgi:hypothetical protein